jgi:hypothetical protein
LYPKNWGIEASLRLYPEKLGDWILLLVAARKKRKFVIPMNVILEEI